MGAARTTPLAPEENPAMTYRAVLIDPESQKEKPVQVLGNHYVEIRRWAAEVLKTAGADSVVNVYQTIEQHIAIIAKPKPEPDPQPEEIKETTV
jgi:hypothetical protein